MLVIKVITLVSFAFSNEEEPRVSINFRLCKSGFRLGLCPFRKPLLLRFVLYIRPSMLCHIAPMLRYIASSMLQRIALSLLAVYCLMQSYSTASCHPTSVVFDNSLFHFV